MSTPLMPKATAVWLIDKTSLTFDQVADFVGMHPLEVQAIADGEVAQGIVGYDPVANGQLTREEIARCEADPQRRLGHARRAPFPSRRSAARARRYTPVAKRNDRPDGIAWLLRNYPQLTDSQVGQAAGHHQGDHRQGARPHPLELGQHQAARPGDPGPLHPVRPERPGQPPSAPQPRARRPWMSTRPEAGKADAA